MQQSRSGGGIISCGDHFAQAKFAELKVTINRNRAATLGFLCGAYSHFYSVVTCSDRIIDIIGGILLYRSRRMKRKYARLVRVKLPRYVQSSLAVSIIVASRVI